MELIILTTDKIHKFVTQPTSIPTKKNTIDFPHRELFKYSRIFPREHVSIQKHKIPTHSESENPKVRKSSKRKGNFAPVNNAARRLISLDKLICCYAKNTAPLFAKLNDRLSHNFWHNSWGEIALACARLLLN